MSDDGYHYHGEYDARNRRTWFEGEHWVEDRALLAGVVQRDTDEPLEKTKEPDDE